MKLLFDARYIRTDFHDGISRYSAELGKSLASLAPVTFIIHDQAQLKMLPENAEYVLIHKPTSAMEPFTALVLNRYQPDVVFSPMQTIGSFGRNFKLILTLHDMIYYRHRTPPHNLHLLVRAGWRLYHMTYVPQRLTLNSADAVVTVSETSKKDFKNVNLTKRPIKVVPNAPQKLHELLGKPHEFNAKNPRNLVYMGSFMPYKNVETLIAGMQDLPDHTLHLLSRISPSRKSELMAQIPKNAKVIFHGGVSDEKYAEILADNAVLVTASRDEGYGLPLAEALELGVPAIVSDLEIFHEVAGDGALYFPTDDPSAFAKQVKKLDDAKLRRQIIENGQSHIAKFNWEKSAEILLGLIKEITQLS